jgi:hypothetical protein
VWRREKYRFLVRAYNRPETALRSIINYGEEIFLNFPYERTNTFLVEHKFNSLYGELKRSFDMSD